MHEWNFHASLPLAPAVKKALTLLPLAPTVTDGRTQTKIELRFYSTAGVTLRRCVQEVNAKNKKILLPLAPAVKKHYYRWHRP
jgi:hypothetical protein